jgi:hypothetical protein
MSFQVNTIKEEKHMNTKSTYFFGLQPALRKPRFAILSPTLGRRNSLVQYSVEVRRSPCFHKNKGDLSLYVSTCAGPTPSLPAADL